MTYHMEGNFGGRKIWQIAYQAIFDKIKFGKLQYGAPHAIKF